jgi:lipoprotein-releasing system permease protein
MVDVNAILVLVLMILVAAINMVATLLILILERTNMIGILKALGAKNSFIQKIFMYNAVHILSKGLLWGNAIALIVEFLQLKFGIFKLNPQTYYISQVPIDFNIFHIALINIGSLLVCVLILLLPSLLVSKIKPAKAIRFN